MKERKKTDISVEKAKQILTAFFEKNSYYLWRDNLAQSDTENHISLLFVTDKRDGADIRVLEYLPNIEGWSVSDSDSNGDNIFIEMIKKEKPLRKFISKFLNDK